jgi:hypothetical protein
MNVPQTQADKEDFVERWHGRIERAYRSRQDIQERWEVLQQYYQGNYFDEPSLRKDRVASMLSFVCVRQMAANLYYQDPSFNFTGRTIQGIKDAQIAQALYMLERRIIGAEPQERRAVDYALIYGTGILKHGWNAQYGNDAAWADQKQRRKSAGVFNDKKPSAYEDLLLPLGPMTEHNTSIAYGHANVKAIAPWDFLIDSDAITYEEAAWCAHRFTRRWVDVIRDTRYDKAARKQLEEAGPTGMSPSYAGGFIPENFRSPANLPGDARDSGLCVLYEMYDRSSQQIIVISPDITLPLVMRDYDYQGREGPYTVLQFFPRDDSFWAIPYMDTFTNEVLTVNKALTNASDHYQRYTSRSRGIYNEQYIDPDKMKELCEAEDGEYISVRSMQSGMSLDQVISHFPTPDISADTWQVTDMFMQLLRQVSGISENDLGSGKGVQTATEASIIQSQTSLRKGDMRFCVDNFLREAARKTVNLMRQFWSGDEVVPVVGPEGSTWNMPITPQILRGEYDVDIEPGSTERVDRQARFRQSIELLRESVQLNQVLMQQGQQIDLGELYKVILRDSDVVKNPSRIVVPVGQPMAQPQPMMGQGQPGVGPSQNMLGGPPPPALGVVNDQGRMPQATDAFQNGRAYSESFN